MNNRSFGDPRCTNKCEMFRHKLRVRKVQFDKIVHKVHEHPVGNAVLKSGNRKSFDVVERSIAFVFR